MIGFFDLLGSIFCLNIFEDDWVLTCPAPGSKVWHILACLQNAMGGHLEI